MNYTIDKNMHLKGNSNKNKNPISNYFQNSLDLPGWELKIKNV